NLLILCEESTESPKRYFLAFEKIDEFLRSPNFSKDIFGGFVGFQRVICEKIWKTRFLLNRRQNLNARR
ncbi:MAG: hypothetical protein ACLPNY_05970, partial [Roseiarcus sp.]